MKSILLLSITLVVISAQERTGFYTHNPAGDTGEAYVHDTTGDFGPYYYWKLRQQAKKEQERSSGVPKSQPQPEAQPKRKVVSVRKQIRRPQQQQQQQQPQPQQSRFANFQARTTVPTAPAAPARQPQVFQATVRQQRPAQRQPQQPTAPAVGPNQRFSGLRFQFQIQAPEFNYQNNHAENSYAFASPLYATTAKGGSYSYSATY